MSARTSTKSASPPRSNIVSGEVASSRESPGSAGAAVFVTFGSFGLVCLGLGFAASRR